ncbi:hypothetical protein [Sediminibacillus albus]|uniref:Spore coat protein YutH n=1 Tax=Sediminibacillus albus TaxID=407036 RepID=A0A1G8YY76_9BACI|nr:hypothetical protein [Sediminibacillus albus]SDK07741.1 spore coat protein YutH [Sediminibacillus albus]
MHELLSEYIDGFQGRQTTINGREGYQQGNDIFFIIPKTASDGLYYEQKSICDFYIHNEIKNLAVPIYNKNGELITEYGGDRYVVLHSEVRQEQNYLPHAAALATFHKLGSTFPFQPTEASAYGQWKELWISKLAMFDTIYRQQYTERPVSNFMGLFIDTYPYVSGCTENAIQYLQETESEQRFDQGDSGTFTFQRYHYDVQKEIIWPHDLVYDHAGRDIAEHIRQVLLEDHPSVFDEVRAFMEAYTAIKPLSIFSWRIIYARLLLPVHLFDYLETGISRDDHETTYKEFKSMLKKQHIYQGNIKKLFEETGVDTNALQIPELDWQ